MRTIRYLFVFIMIFGFASYAFAEEDYDGKLEDREMDALRKWIREKRLVTVKEIGGDLSLSGEIHYSFKGSSEEKNGQQQRGPHGATTVPIYNFDIEGDIVLDYQAPRAWASMQLEFANSMGQISGTTNRISLDRAYFGGRIID
ncbi:MAG TPA: hypothetical protein P5048_03555, partial [Chlamydiales bacterium]|nr:hypothetical protein [Chlamydiales bacterium]